MRENNPKLGQVKMKTTKVNIPDTSDDEKIQGKPNPIIVLLVFIFLGIIACAMYSQYLENYRLKIENKKLEESIERAADIIDKQGL